MLEIQKFYRKMNKPFRMHFISFEWLPFCDVPLTDNEFFGIYCMGGEL